jgi:hypothetical protein
MIPRKDSSRHAIYSLLSGRVGFWIDNWEIVPDFPRKPALWVGFLFPRSPTGGCPGATFGAYPLS